MLIDEVSGIFAHKKTMKQFLQPMMEQVWGGGGVDVPGGCVAILGQFFRATIFCVGFFLTEGCLFGSILPIFAYFWRYIMCISSKVKQCFGQKNFRDLELISNF